jgi:hypothetical protein
VDDRNAGAAYRTHEPEDQRMNNFRTYVFVLIGAIAGAVASMGAPGLGIAFGIACGAGVGVALASPPARCGPGRRSRRGRG